MAVTVQQVSTDFRKTSAGINLGRSLFGGGPIPNPTQITGLLKQAGVNVPPGVQVTADAAQILMAGGAVVSNVEKGADIFSYCMPTAQILGAVEDLFSVLGIADPSSPGMQMMKIGGDVAMVVATGGLNIIADISLVLDLIQDIFFPPDDRPKVTAEVENKVSQDVANFKAQRASLVAGEKTAAASQFSDFQNGKTSFFSMIANVAEQSPDVFLNYFPDFKTFVPPTTLSQTFTESEEAGYGGTIFGIGRHFTTITRSATVTWQRVFTDDMKLASAFVQKYLAIPATPYRMIQAFGKSKIQANGYPIKAINAGEFDPHFPVWPRISFMDMSVLSLFPPYINYIHDDFDIYPYMKNLGLTMSDLGYGNIFNSAMDNLNTYKPKYKTLTSPAISINGVDLYSQGEAQYNDSVTSYDKKASQLSGQITAGIAKAKLAERTRNIAAIAGIKGAQKIYTEWGIMPYATGQQENTYDSSQDMLGYRNIQNYWSMIGLFDRMRNDAFFSRSSLNGMNPFADVARYIPTAAAIEARYKEIQFKIVGRSLNQKAKANVAGFFGVKPEKITFNQVRQGQLASVRIAK